MAALVATAPLDAGRVVVAAALTEETAKARATTTDWTTERIVVVSEEREKAVEMGKWYKKCEETGRAKD